MKQKILVGIRPTGKLHIGHYLSVVRPALEEEADVLIADLHAPLETYDRIHYLRNDLVKCGVDPRRILHQNEEFDVGFYFQLMALAPIGHLKRMTQFKSAKKPTAHLLTYPVLMAHDIAGYDRVIVGDDQRQHLEFARILLGKLGIPSPVGDYRGGRVMSLTDPTKKMSKSDPRGCIFIGEDNTKAIKKAVTTPAGRKNLEFIHQEFVGGEVPKLNRDLKKELIEAFHKGWGHGM